MGIKTCNYLAFVVWERDLPIEYSDYIQHELNTKVFSTLFLMVLDYCRNVLSMTYGIRMEYGNNTKNGNVTAEQQ